MRKALSAVFIVALMSAFASAENNPKQQKCTDDHSPVCARLPTRPSVIATFSNECFATMAGAIKIRNGACPVANCPAIYEPVCARRVPSMTPGQGPPYTVKAYINSCFADQEVETPPKEGVVILMEFAEVQVKARSLDFDKICPIACDEPLDIVCAKDISNKNRLYDNKCTAVLDGAVVQNKGRCPR